MKKKVLGFDVTIEKDEDGVYTGSVPSIRGCHTQGRTLHELLEHMKEAIELCLEAGVEISRESGLGSTKSKESNETSSALS